MAKVQDTYNPVTGEYVKRISDWTTINGSYNWSLHGTRRVGYKTLVNWLTIADADPAGYILMTKHDSRVVPNIVNTTIESVYLITKYPILTLPINEFGISDNVDPTTSEIKAYFHGWKMCNSDATSPYYKSEVPYTPATYMEWTVVGTNTTKGSSGIHLSDDGFNEMVHMATNLKVNTKYGILFSVLNMQFNSGAFLYDSKEGLSALGGGYMYPQKPVVGNNKYIINTPSTIANNYFGFRIGGGIPGDYIDFKDIRVFELPAGSQIEADFTNLSADELSAKYTFNGLCVKHWKKVTDGTGLTSTLPTSSYEGYTPYRMIYQLATPEISYLTPKAEIPLYDTNTIVETDTPSDCKADVTVGYKLKDGVTVVAGDITAPTPDYMSAVNSVSEDGLKKGIVKGKNLLPHPYAYTSRTTNGITFTVNSDGSINISGTASGNADFHFLDMNNSLTIDSGTYTYSLSSNVSTGIVFITGGLSSNLSYSEISGSPYNRTFTTTSSGKIGYSLIRILNGTTISGKIYPQLEKSATNTAYETYKIPVKATLPTLRKIGTVADSYNPETGVLTQRIGKKVFDGTENWVAGTIVDNTIRFNCNDFSPEEALSAFRSNMASVNSHFKIDNASYDYGVIGQSGSTSDKGIYLRVSLNTAGNLAQFKAWLAQQYANGTPVTVYYQLATPVVTTLTKTALPTYKPTTVIESDSTVKGNVSADYKLKANATPVAGDFIASPECVNDIKDLGNSIDVVSSVGRRNLIPDTNKGIARWRWNIPNGTYIKEEVDALGVRAVKMKCVTKSSNWYVLMRTLDLDKVKRNTTYTLSLDVLTSQNCTIGISIKRADNTNSLVYFGDTSCTTNVWKHVKLTATTNNIVPTDQEFYFTGIGGTNGDEIIIANLKMEESSVESNWTPAPEDIQHNTITNGVYKTNILLANPLRSVGDVKDRLFKDSDGKWKVERNIGEYTYNGSGGVIWNLGYSGNGWLRNQGTTPFYTYNGINALKKINGLLIANNLETRSDVISGNTEGFEIGASNYCSIRVETGRLADESPASLNTWLSNNPVTIQYQLAMPIYETLSQELQTDLNNIPTFPEHNYVYTVTNDNLQPTLHVDYKKLSWLKSRLLLNSLKIYSRNLTDAEMEQNYRIEKERYGM